MLYCQPCTCWSLSTVRCQAICRHSDASCTYETGIWRARTDTKTSVGYAYRISKWYFHAQNKWLCHNIAYFWSDAVFLRKKALFYIEVFLQLICDMMHIDGCISINLCFYINSCRTILFVQLSLILDGIWCICFSRPIIKYKLLVLSARIFCSYGNKTHRPPPNILQKYD